VLPLLAATHPAATRAILAGRAAHRGFITES
jgi:hypothetical protein